MEVGDLRVIDDPQMGELAVPSSAGNAWEISSATQALPGVQPVTLTDHAAQALAKADAAVQHAQALRDAILTGILAQAGLPGGQVVKVEPGPPMVLHVQ